MRVAVLIEGFFLVTLSPCHLFTLPHNPLPPKKRTVVVKAKQPTRLRTDTLHTLTLKKMHYTSIVFSLAYSHFMACHEGTSVSSKNINLSIVFLLAYSYLYGKSFRYSRSLGINQCLDSWKQAFLINALFIRSLIAIFANIIKKTKLWTKTHYKPSKPSRRGYTM